MPITSVTPDDIDDNVSVFVDDVTFYVNVVDKNDSSSETNPQSITDQHLASQSEAEELARDYLAENPSIMRAEICAYTTYSDGTGQGSERPVSCVTREDMDALSKSLPKTGPRTR